jgi:hypothetical protein
MTKEITAMLLKPVEERREIARAAILATPLASDRRLSKETGLSRDMIGRIRVNLQRATLIRSDQPVLGCDGKTYHNTPHVRTSFRLLTITAKVKQMAKIVEDESWRLADPQARRILWLAAVKLADIIGESIDVTTGHLVIETPKCKRKIE